MLVSRCFTHSELPSPDAVDSAAGMGQTKSKAGRGAVTKECTVAHQRVENFMAVRILLVDDHPIVRQGLRTLLQGRGDWEVVGEASDGLEAVEKVDICSRMSSCSTSPCLE
jgi:PleD family two-component response regulator